MTSLNLRGGHCHSPHFTGEKTEAQGEDRPAQGTQLKEAELDSPALLRSVCGERALLPRPRPQGYRLLHRPASPPRPPPMKGGLSEGRAQPRPAQALSSSATLGLALSPE